MWITSPCPLKPSPPCQNSDGKFKNHCNCIKSIDKFCNFDWHWKRHQNAKNKIQLFKIVCFVFQSKFMLCQILFSMATFKVTVLAPYTSTYFIAALTSSRFAGSTAHGILNLNNNHLSISANTSACCLKTHSEALTRQDIQKK